MVILLILPLNSTSSLRLEDERFQMGLQIREAWKTQPNSPPMRATQRPQISTRFRPLTWFTLCMLPIAHRGCQPAPRRQQGIEPAEGPRYDEARS
jgi:hypothetical protein